MSKETFTLLKRLVHIRKNKKKIPEWRAYYLLKIGISSYAFYKLSEILEGEGVIDQEKKINWNKLDQFIQKLHKKVLEDLEYYDHTYDPYFEKFVSSPFKKDGNK